MELIRLPNTATADEISAKLKEHGYVIVDNLVDPEVMDKIAEETSEYIDTSPFGGDKFLGAKTQRTGSLISRSVTSRQLITHPTVLGVVGKHLEKSTTYQLHLTQIITVHPGSPAQVLHQDQLAWDFFEFPDDFEPQCNLLWAMTDYTEENGATRLVPGSMYKGTKQKFSQEESIAAEMKKGSALFYTGKIYHGAGENKTDSYRQAINITYAAGWLRQEENQYISTPPEVAKTLDDDLLKLMGYQCACFAIGYARDFEDPLSVFKGIKENKTTGMDVVVDHGHSEAKQYVLEENLA
ncbi:phytanoyl-CoA dioxygenase [Acinetobacter sp. LoGeW2-3]|uniref:phytanoyl-CoA dioxygenase family protein n=1 Tax=Acinetobacter sp. LoGeW2-3 TaxID=1808001 RepID=UPI000C05C196|nr:phytanoyl-CoA dioxygenase family protein [Acinetobacter sp. LoGeW2-3]ATO18456.1 phytanoyl-CoA dioxygenase [Acinetobacter sp. LoGeW2-3]